MYDEQLRFGQVLGDSIRQVGRHWIFFLGMGLANVLLYLPGSYLASHLATMGSDSYATNLILVYGIQFVNALLACLIYGIIIDFVNQVYHRPPASAAEAMRLAVRRWPGLVWTLVVRWFWLILGFMLLIIPGILWGYRQMLCWVVTTVEGISGPAALRRAQALMNADTSVYGILFGHWLLCMILCVVPSTVAGFALIHQSVAVRTAVQSSAGVAGFLIYGVYYFAMVRVYVYLRQRLERTPEEDGVGFSPSFEL